MAHTAEAHREYMKRREVFYPSSMKLKTDISNKAATLGFSKSDVVNAAVSELFQKPDSEIIHAIMKRK
jgi:hypothetical protein